MKHKIVQIIIIAFVVIIACILFFACGSKSTEAETSQVDSYELYVLDVENRLTFYNIYKVKSENIRIVSSYGNIITIYNTTDGTQIIFANNGITIVSPQGYKENFTQGLMQRKWRT